MIGWSRTIGKDKLVHVSMKMVELIKESTQRLQGNAHGTN